MRAQFIDAPLDVIREEAHRIGRPSVCACTSHDLAGQALS
jgi:hypothetical protein